MEISIKNLGPLRDARLELGDITVLLGPSNSGKSYTLKSLYGKLAILDETALDYIVRSIAEEMEVWENIKHLVYPVVPKVLVTLMVLQDCLTRADTREEIIRHLEDQVGIEELDVEIEDEELIVTLQNSETMDVQDITALLNEKYDLVLHELLPITEETEIRIPEVPTPKFSSMLLEAFEIPFDDEAMGKDTRSGINAYLQLSRKVEGGSVKFSVIVKIHARLDDFVKTSFKRDIDRLMDRISTNKEKGIIEGVIENIFDPKIPARIRSYIYFRIRMVFRDLSEAVSPFMEESFVRPLKEQLRDVYKETFNAQSAVFIPFGRSPFVYQVNRVGKDQWGDLVEIYKDNLPFYSYIHHLEKGINGLGSGKFNETLIKFFNPVLQGELIFEKPTQKLRYQKWNSVDVPIDQASALAGEVAGILLPILSVPSNSLLLIEEPEAQLHYSAQVLMALTLAGLSRGFNHRIVLSTHSDILAITLAYLKELEYDEDKVSELIEELLEAQGIKVEREKVAVLAKAVSGAKDLDIRFYYYEPRPDGTVEVLPTPTKDILREVPGITEVTDILASWALNL